jgi:hypothetical protein
MQLGRIVFEEAGDTETSRLTIAVSGYHETTGHRILVSAFESRGEDQDEEGPHLVPRRSLY